MTTADAPRSRRPWYRRFLRVHPSTWMVVLIAAAMWAVVIIAGERHWLPERVEHGWPLCFLTRQRDGTESIYSVWPVIRYLSEPGLWMRPERCWESTFHAGAFLGDVAIALLGLTALAFVLEWRRRRVRHFWQLSLREVAVLVLLAAAPCAWWGGLYRECRRQEAVLQELRNGLSRAVMGDGISSTMWISHCEACWESRGDWFLEWFWAEDKKPRWFGQIVELTLMVEQDAADEALAQIGQLSSLRRLVVQVYGGSRRLSDESVQSIAALADLEDLTIQRVGSNWDMSAIGLTDTQVAQLASLKELRALDLSNNYITDEGLRALHGLKHLETLEISNNAITDAGVDELRQAIPGLQVLDD